MLSFHPIASGSSGNCYVVRDGKSTMLIDAGIPILKIKKALDFKLSNVSGMLCTHRHLDHIGSVHALAKAGIDCYMSAETAEGTGISDHHRIHEVEPMKKFNVDDFCVLAFPTQHDCPGSLGFLISNGVDRLLFATDTFYIKYRFSNLSIVAIECNWDKRTLAPGLDPSRKIRLYRSHFNLQRVKQFLQANDLSKVREIWLIHMSRDNSDADLFVKEIQELTGKPTFAA